MLSSFRISVICFHQVKLEKPYLVAWRIYEVKGPNGGTITSYILTTLCDNKILICIVTALLPLFPYFVIEYIHDETHVKFLLFQTHP